MIVRLGLCLLMVMAMIVPGARAMADELRPGAVYLTETAPGRWLLAWKQPLAAPGPAPLIVPELPAVCRLEGPPQRRAAPMAVIGRANARCTAPLAGRAIGWQGVAGRGDALLRVAPLGRAVQSFRLTAESPEAVIAAAPGRMQVARSYFTLGVAHILAGWDHLLFVIALVLLVARPWPVVKAATAFTVAHSLTLAAAALGHAGLPQQPVEALIALSIVFLAVELARGQQATLLRGWPWLVAFGFGLLHGFGFAGALREIGMPDGEVPMALVAFNLGVEAGQLAVIAAVLAVRAGIARMAPGTEAGAVRLAAYAIGITGSYWLIDRVIA